MKQVVSATDIIITLSKQEIIRQNKCQKRFLDKLVLKQNFDQKLMINYINCSMMDYPSTCDDTDNVFCKSKVL